MSDPDENAAPHPQPLPGDANDEYERMLSQHGLGQEPLQPERPKRAGAAASRRDMEELPEIPKPVRPAQFALAAFSRYL